MKKVLVTGANGEIGTALVPVLRSIGLSVVTLDINPHADFKVDITNLTALRRVFFEVPDIDTVIHLAAVLSTTGEKEPLLAHNVNSTGTLNLLSLSEGKTFFFPSSIAVYGDGKLQPQTIYGVAKIYGENLGSYFDKIGKLDFRSIRFPGLISTETVPSGGTSDFGPEMLHAAAQGKQYQCFVRADSKLPFMVMPDAVNAIIRLLETPKERLISHVYDITAFSMAASDFEKVARDNFENVNINYNPDEMRQKIVDSWPNEVDDSLARRDWDWKPEFNFEKAFSDYILPDLKKRYS